MWGLSSSVGWKGEEMVAGTLASLQVFAEEWGAFSEENAVKAGSTKRCEKYLTLSIPGQKNWKKRS